jgi:hypothetical protein
LLKQQISILQASLNNCCPTTTSPTTTVVPTTTTTTHVIRVLLNGKPVFSVDFDTKNSLGHGPEELLSIADFQAIVSKLEDDGGHDYDRLLGRQPVNTK